MPNGNSFSFLLFHRLFTEPNLNDSDDEEMKGNDDNGKDGTGPEPAISALD